MAGVTVGVMPFRFFVSIFGSPPHVRKNGPFTPSTFRFSAVILSTYAPRMNSGGSPAKEIA